VNEQTTTLLVLLRFASHINYAEDLFFVPGTKHGRGLFAYNIHPAWISTSNAEASASHDAESTQLDATAAADAAYAAWACSEGDTDYCGNDHAPQIADSTTDNNRILSSRLLYSWWDEDMPTLAKFGPQTFVTVGCVACGKVDVMIKVELGHTSPMHRMLQALDRSLSLYDSIIWFHGEQGP